MKFTYALWICKAEALVKIHLLELAEYHLKREAREASL
jgi:hypothetical protein